MPYDPNFINDEEIPLPTANDRVLASAFGGDYIHHSRHSILFNQDRGFAFVSAHNVNGSEILPAQVSDRDFDHDPKVSPDDLQVDNNRGYLTSPGRGFGPNPWDRGHLARRKSLSWGNENDARRAELESDFWTNIAPQHERLHDTAWGPIEDWVLERVQTRAQRACVFTGPVFTEDDPEHRNGANEIPIRIPAGFWKVITVKLDGRMRSAGFLIWQRDYDHEEPLSFSPLLEQVRLTTIEVLTGLTFPTLRLFDPLIFDQQTRRRLLNISTSRATLRNRALSTPRPPFSESLDGLDDALIIRATEPGNSIITDKRDILL